MPTPTINVYRGTLYFEGYGAGWSETFDIANTDEVGATQNMGQLAVYRSYLLPPAIKISYGRLTVPGQKGLSLALLNAPVLGASQTLTTKPGLDVDNVNDSLCFRIQAVDHKFCIRHIRGIPDDQIGAGTLTFPPPITGWIAANPSPTNGPGTPTDWPTALTYFLAVYATNCSVITKVPPVNGVTMIPAQWYSHAITGALLRGVRSKKTGRIFDAPAGRLTRR